MIDVAKVRRKIAAYAAGRPLPRGATLPVPVDREGSLRLALVRMGGESLPWGVGYRTAAGDEGIIAVPDPRNQGLVAAMIEAVAPVLLRHLGHPLFAAHDVEGEADVAAAEDDDEEDDDVPPRNVQVWLPDGSHLDMLRYLALRYTFDQRGDPTRATVRAFGRAAGWLVREAEREPLLAVVGAANALREAFTFPCEDARQYHLGYLLAWLDPAHATRDARLAAATAAEAVPGGITLDPQQENRELEPLVAAYSKEREAAGPDAVTNPTPAMRDAAAAIEAAIARELRWRLDLLDRALDRLGAEADQRPVNEGLHRLWRRFHALHRGYLTAEQELAADDDGTGPSASPETDHNAVTGARRFFEHAAAAEERFYALIGHDEALQQEAVEAGEALAGRVVERDTELVNERPRPRFRLHADPRLPLKLKAPQAVTFATHQSAGVRLQELRLVETDEGEPVREARLVVHAGAVPADLAVGDTVTFVPKPGFALSRKKRALLTRAAPDTDAADDPDDPDA